MIGLSILAVRTLPERRSDLPLIYWTTDANEARGPQILGFEQWLRDNGYREVDLELDCNNSGQMKVIIQAASGVGSPIIDVYQGRQLRQYVAAGVLIPLDDIPEKYGLGEEFRRLATKWNFGPDRTYPAVAEEIMVNGKQYTFPCNVSGWPLTINRAVLDKRGRELLKYDWNWDEFLEWCKAVRKVDEYGRVTRYAVMPFGAEYLWPGAGASIFNETMTRCTLDSPQAIEATQFYFDLMFEHEVMPTPEDEAAATEGGWGSKIKWLGGEQAVAHHVGRWALVTLRRDYKKFKPDVALIPHKVMPMQFVSSRSAGISASVKDVKLVARFLQYLASDPYNDLIVDDADALPPNPTLTPEQQKRFDIPPGYEHEKGVAEKFRLAVVDHGVGREYSPFVLPPIVDRAVYKWQEGIANELISVEKGMQELTKAINKEIDRTVERNPKLREGYNKAVARQKEIDDLKRAGKPVPLEWIDNPVIRRLREAGK